MDYVIINLGKMIRPSVLDFPAFSPKPPLCFVRESRKTTHFLFLHISLRISTVTYLLIGRKTGLSGYLSKVVFL